MNPDDQRLEFDQSLRMMRDRLVPKLPANIKRKVLPEIEKLEDLLVDTRPPKFAIVGRRGAGKSTLINAIFQDQVADVGSVTAETERASWHTYTDKTNETIMEVLDTRGFGEGASDRFQMSEERTWEEALANKYPDAILFLIKAKEVDSRIQEDIGQLKALQQQIKEKHDYVPPIVGIVTQVDELDPIYDHTPPFGDSKQRAIQQATAHLEKLLAKQFNDIAGVLPVCAYLAFENGRIVYDRRWNIHRLIDFLLEQLPNNT